ncbi:methyl-accepting chemotaxis protein [Desulfovibrio aminophilus]|nr:methyl-accepting chemotaxis protein [Desulfovibrio aminophilus]MCM0754048.1 methyl-accepting chemotaxis protein [Desulfovibrio aminophilus]
MRCSIKTKLIAGLLTVVLLIMAGLFAFVGANFSEQAREAAIRGARGEMVQVESAITLFLDESLMNVEIVARHPLAARADEVTTSYLQTTERRMAQADPGDLVGQGLTDLMTAMLRAHPVYAQVYAGTADGAFVTSPKKNPQPEGYDPRRRPWYQATRDVVDRPVLHDAYVSTTGAAVTCVTRAIVRDGRVLGVAAIDIALDNLTGRVKSIHLGRTGHMVLIQDNGVILADPRHENQNFKKVSELENRALESLFRLGSGEMDLTIDGTEWLGLVLTSEKTGWRLVGLIERDEITAPVRQTLLLLGGACLLALALLAGAVWFLANAAIIRPLMRVADFLEALAQGVYDRRLDHSRKDEIGRIYDALNRTAQELQDNIEEIRAKRREAENKARAAEQAGTAAEQARAKAEQARTEGMLLAARRLEETARHIGEASARITSKSRDIRGGTETQRDRIQSTATAMEEMNATVLEVAKNAGDAAEQGKRSKDTAQAGAAVVARAIEAMNGSQRQAEVLQSNMAQLDDRARAIGNVITVIEDIADQTNLLALNAAIEAARAGEAGRGFAVVADEVRKLAEKTMTATKEVGHSIESIQKVAAANISSMQGALDDLSKATGLARDSGEALAEIVADAEASAGQIQSIAAAAEQQALASEEINRSIEEIHTIALDTSGNAEESLAGLEDLEHQASALSGLIRGLKSEAGQGL